MPGHIIEATCSCGFYQDVMPGSPNAIPFVTLVIAYDPIEPVLVTVTTEEAQAKRLVVIENPYIGEEMRSMGSDEIDQIIHKINLMFPCQECKKVTMRLNRMGFWN